METLKTAIKEWLAQNGFTYHENKEKPSEDCWYKQWIIPGPTQTISMNGQVQQFKAPDTQVSLAFNYDEEPGYVCNPDDTDKQEFLLGKWVYTYGVIDNSQLRQEAIYQLNDFIAITRMLCNL